MDLCELGRCLPHDFFCILRLLVFGWILITDKFDLHELLWLCSFIISRFDLAPDDLVLFFLADFSRLDGQICVYFQILNVSHALTIQLDFGFSLGSTERFFAT